MSSSFIEPLEARIAPAAILTLTDIDGDIVTITTSKGTDAQLDLAVSRSPAGIVGGVKINGIDLSSTAAFDGTDLRVIAKRSSLGGDGRVNIGSIDADDDLVTPLDTALNLGRIVIDGNLVDFDAGKGTPGSSVKSLKVQSTSGSAEWNIRADLGALKVENDLRGSHVNVGTGFSLGAVSIGGSLLGGDTPNSGYITAGAKIGTIRIDGDIKGSTGYASGSIYATSIDSLHVGGSLIGGTGGDSARIDISTLGALKIGGDVDGGDGHGATIYASTSIDTIKIGGNMLGGSGGAASILVGSPFLKQEAQIGMVSIRGSVVGAETISGSIRCYGDIGSVKIGGDLLGGIGFGSGGLDAGGKLGSVTIGGSMLGGDGFSSGSIYAGDGIKSLGIGGDLRSGSGKEAGSIFGGRSNLITDTGDGIISTLRVRGEVVGLSPSAPVQIEASGFAEDAGPGVFDIKKIKVGGGVENALVRVLDGDAKLRSILVRGDWVASTIAVGVEAGADNLYGTPDDLSADSNDPSLFSRIASITIGGKVRGTSASGDHFGFVAQEIGSFSVSGTKLPLTPGRSNDNVGLVNPKFELGSNSDVSVREVA
jgi:hypothetical protein